MSILRKLRSHFLCIERPPQQEHRCWKYAFMIRIIIMVMNILKNFTCLRPLLVFLQLQFLLLVFSAHLPLPEIPSLTYWTFLCWLFAVSSALPCPALLFPLLVSWKAFWKAFSSWPKYSFIWTMLKKLVSFTSTSTVRRATRMRRQKRTENLILRSLRNLLYWKYVLHWTFKIE